jgi:hypothetical protein
MTNQGEADAVRRQVLEKFLLGVRVNSDDQEFNALVDALFSGGDHPLLQAWERRRQQAMEE